MWQTHNTQYIRYSFLLFILILKCAAGVYKSVSNINIDSQFIACYVYYIRCSHVHENVPRYISSYVCTHLSVL